METGPEDLTVLRTFLAKLIATAKTDELLDIVLALVARLMRNEAKLTGKLKALLRGHAGGGTEQFGTKQLQLWKDALDEAVGGIVNVDLAEVAVRLNQAQFAYQASSSVFNTLRGLTLLDVLK